MFWPDDQKWYLIQIDTVDPGFRKSRYAGNTLKPYIAGPSSPECWVVTPLCYT